MKRTGVLAFALFYLLLTTGMFVCVMHCSAKDVAGVTGAGKVKIEAGHSCCHKAKLKRRLPANDCCKKHPNYLVKENLGPEQNTLPSLTATLVNQPLVTRIFLPCVQAAVKALLIYDHGPPGICGKNYLIQIRSLLI